MTQDRIRIVVVEDSATIRARLREILEEAPEFELGRRGSRFASGSVPTR
jgi:chemotaxis response regulator CheB